jgi:hypothetical protein
MKSKRLCHDCADTLRDGYELREINKLQVFGKCDICNRSSMLTTYQITSKRKVEGRADDNRR